MVKVKVKTVSEYIQKLEDLGIDNYIYRGQNEPYYGINANGFRLFKDQFMCNKRLHIDELSKEYYNQITSKLTYDEKKYFLAFCQHHGIPTNLIDFSYSPLIALFFACEGKKDPTLSISEILNGTTVENFESYNKTKKELIDSISHISKIIKNKLSTPAQVSLINKKWLLDVTDIISQIGDNNFLESIYVNGDIRTYLINKLSGLFSTDTFTLSDISDTLSKMIDCYIINRVDYYGADVTEDEIVEMKASEDENLFSLQQRINSDTIAYEVYHLYNYVFEEMQDENITYGNDIFDGFPEEGSIEQVAAATYILLLTNLVQIFHNHRDCNENLILDLKIYFTYQPANLFDRINAQQGLFIYQPYFYGYDLKDKKNILSIQRVHPDYIIEIFDCETILSDLNVFGINLGNVYGDFDNIAKSIVNTYTRKNNV